MAVSKNVPAKRNVAAKPANKGKGKVAGKGTAAKATTKQHAASGEKPATALDRAGDAKPIGKVPVPKHLLGKVGPSKKEGGFDGNKFGISTGLKIVHFADALLRFNETRKPQPATDAELNATLAAEFPTRHDAKASGVKGVPTLQPISAFRAYHNAFDPKTGEYGKHGCAGGLNDGHKSHSYNSEGVARTLKSDKPSPKGKASKGK